MLLGILYFALNFLFGSLLGEFGYEVPDYSFDFFNEMNETIVNDVDNYTFYDVLFFPNQTSSDKLINYIVNGTNVKCVFYDIDDYFIELLINQSNNYTNLEILSYLPNKKHLDMLEYQYDPDDYYTISSDNIDISVQYIDKSYGLMHNKFCIVDNKYILTGSMNPTYNGLNRNDNNMIVIDSSKLVDNYNDEFNELKYDKDNAKVQNKEIILCNDECFVIENFFCPEDKCESNVIQEINKANQSIVFYTFSFTSKNIADALILKAQEINIKGIFEKRQNSQYSVMDYIDGYVNVSFDKNKYTMHHKVFVIDDTVIMGSFNPTNNGNKNNDENILIIHNKEIADLYRNEFEKLHE